MSNTKKARRPLVIVKVTKLAKFTRDMALKKDPELAWTRPLDTVNHTPNEQLLGVCDYQYEGTRLA